MNRCTSCPRNMPTHVTFMRCYRCRNLAKSKDRYYARKAREIPVGDHIGNIAGAYIAERITGERA